MNIGELFTGIAVIFDDEIADGDSTIAKIKEHIEEKNIPVAIYQTIPQIGMIPSLSNASFIILDWDYTKPAELDPFERITIPETLKDNQEQELLVFIQELMKQIFIPVFIFTSYSVDHIKDKLRGASLWSDDKVNRIFIKQKNDVCSEEQLFQAMEEWLKEMPSVYALKEWERTVSKTKDKMFLELYGYSPNWVKVIWDMIKADSIENHSEFGEFITRTLNNRIEEYRFDEDILNKEQNISREELKKVTQGERYFAYQGYKPKQAYTGDLFIGEEGKYYLNIRAQCDLSRSKGEDYNPQLFCIVGERLRSEKIATEDLKLTPEGYLVFNANKKYGLDELKEKCGDEKKLGKFNQELAKHRNGIFWENGTLIERSNNVIVGSVAEQDALKFNLSICVKSFNELKDSRIGRILPPYITRIQQKCSQYMIREGVMPVPKELFMDFEN